MDYIEELKTLALMLEIAELRIRTASFTYWQNSATMTKRNNHRIEVAMQWCDRRKCQMIQLLNKNIYLIEW